MKIGLLIVPVVAVFAGCTASQRQGATVPVFSEVPSPAQLQAYGSTNHPPEGVVHVGNIVVVTFTNLPNPVPVFIQPVREDGTITLIYNTVFQADGKKTGDLEKEVRDFYVPTCSANLIVTVSLDIGSVYVTGEFRNPGRFPWTNGMRLKDATDAAGGFTDFAGQTIRLTHSDGTKQRYKLSGNRFITDNPILKPSDRILVRGDLF